MRISFVIAVMVHVSNQAAALDWYQRAFPGSTRVTAAGHDFEYLQVDGAQGSMRIEIVKADEKVSSGPSGTVVHWQVEKIASSLAALEKLRTTLYRGPLNIENGEAMCQVQDPWGNCIGLRGALEVTTCHYKLQVVAGRPTK